MYIHHIYIYICIYICVYTQYPMKSQKLVSLADPGCARLCLCRLLRFPQDRGRGLDRCLVPLGVVFVGKPQRWKREHLLKQW